MTFFLVKWLHVISSTILFGTGLGSAFYLFVANRQKEIGGICFASRNVVLADWLFTTPTAIIQPLTGAVLIFYSGYDWTDFWIMAAIGLYIFAGCCWLPVLWLQIAMRDMAGQAYETGQALPERYWRYERWWIILGALAFPAFVVIFWLMVARPV